MSDENSFWVLYGQHDKPTFLEDAGDGQHRQRDASLKYVSAYRNAIDIGSNIGQWTRPLAKKFESVVCFEPNPNFRKCFDKNIDNGSKRFKEGYFAAGTVHIGDQTIKSTATGFVFSGSVSTKGASVTKNDDTTSSVVKKTGISDSESTIESYATSVNDSVLYYIVARDEVNDMVTAQKVTTVHNNSTGFASTTHVTKTGSSTEMTFDGSISGGSMRLRATGGSFSNSISAYKIALGDNHSSGTSGNTAIIINADVDSATENLDTWAHASYRGAKYFISVNDEADDELETLEAMVTHNGTGAFITVYNNVRTGSTGLITLTADISGANVRLRGTGSRANLNVKMHRILLADDENVVGNVARDVDDLDGEVDDDA